MKRRTIFVTAALAIGTIAITATIAMPRRLIWNASASVPVGLYAVHEVDQFRVGDLLAATPPPEIEEFLADGGYVPAGVPLIKHVAALPGQSVCRIGNTITVDMRVVGQARKLDSKDRPLPYWQRCLTLASQQIFLMNTAVPDSLDGRYFGPFDKADIVGRAAPIWTDDAGDGRYIWHGSDSPVAITQTQKGE
ncbi:S26 family signal peptidase [Sphingorhabdus sp. YGSMI21]|uniref:S26 family signal peptidase n=1 Tax=Sphingorhabdus sp. YGSMI21 TaxID=2077182 RepID=UPI000C1E832D|nr:S26 family signal peptidase [Sphingorhabdus sp. YGSMI21]ATW05295.1 S26 family signal peptidase [Sphingorhabdus sp. YGSMI21]